MHIHVCDGCCQRSTSAANQQVGISAARFAAGNVVCIFNKTWRYVFCTRKWGISSDNPGVDTCMLRLPAARELETGMISAPVKSD
jgi:hypothetical protein